MPREKAIPYVHAYNKLQTQSIDFQRDILEVANVWQQEKEFVMPQIDALIAGQLELALSCRESIVVVLDIGSGSGALLSDIKVRPQLTPITHQLLLEHPQLQLHLIGITDAQAQDEFMTVKELAPDLGSSQIRAENYAYTLTFKQSVYEFLTKIQQPKLSLVMATYSLAYMGSNTFIQVLEDSLRTLHSGGKIVISGFVGKHPGFDISNALPRFSQRGLTDITDDLKSNLWKIQNGKLIFDKKVGLIEFVRIAKHVEQQFKHIPEFQQTFAELRKTEIASQLLPLLKSIWKGEKARDKAIASIRMSLNYAIIHTIQKLGNRKILELAKDKFRLLEQFIVNHSSQIASSQKSERSIVVEKK